MGERKGDWIQTFTGRQFWPIDPLPKDVHIDDIAHALSMLCRFAGHCKRFYSVAEHSVLLASKVEPEHALWALLHDASEAYIVDIPRPIKPFLLGYAEAETAIQGAVCKKFGLPETMPSAVKAADRAILTDEAAQNMTTSHLTDKGSSAPLGVTLQFWSPGEAEERFHDAFSTISAVPHANLPSVLWAIAGGIPHAAS